MAATDVAVIGAGPGGLSAAITAADLELKVTLIDESSAPGGQYLVGREAVHQLASEDLALSAAERRGMELLKRLPRSTAERCFETLVWHLAGDRELSPGGFKLGLYHYPTGSGGPGGSRGAIEYLTARAVVLASGAREQVVPFPGWTLPGVMTVGAAQLLAKRHRLIPGRRVVLAGSGPLLLPAAVHLAELGAEVLAVLEASHLRDWLKYTPAIRGNSDRLGEGRRYMGALRRGRIPYRFGKAVVRAEGSAGIELVVVASLDRRGRPVPGTEEEIRVDALCVGFGFVPNTELAQIAGAALHFDPANGGWIPELDDRLQTSVPGLFVAGEAAGISGASSAMLEGRLAGLGAACRLGRITDSELRDAWASSSRRRKQVKRFGVMLNTLFAPAPGLSAITTEDTVVCRCEEVTAGEAQEAIVHGATTLDALKTRTRTGQGPCQGRTCGPILARMIAQHARRSPADAGLFCVRPPLKPVPLAALAEGALP
jgi:NADPH-dependent 2,4-dienoyl-CoA reductase/sulfur reductase-like enzyme/bacterioferritin-associated ferredoxin